MMHNGKPLAVMARCAEPMRRLQKPESEMDAVDHDDSFQITSQPPARLR